MVSQKEKEMNNRLLIELSDSELKKFQKFYDAHLLCKADVDIITLSSIYNVKLIFNFSEVNIVKTAICSICGDEILISDLVEK